MNNFCLWSILVRAASVGHRLELSKPPHRAAQAWPIAHSFLSRARRERSTPTLTTPAQDQQRDIVRGTRTAAESPDVLHYGLSQRFRIASAVTQRMRQAVFAKLIALLVLRFGDAVGVQHQAIAPGQAYASHRGLSVAEQA